MGDAFAAEAASVPFGEPAANQQVSDWISERTHGLLHPQFQFTADTLMCLVNALYLKANWISPFDAEFTTDGEFASPDGPVTVPFMHSSSHGSNLETDDYTAAALSLDGGLAMTFFLPKDESANPRELIATPERVKDLLATPLSDTREVVWTLPKFSFDVEYQLIEQLEALG